MIDSLKIKVEQGVAYLTLNRPQQGNAIHLAMANALVKAAIQCDHDPEIRCVVLTGTGRFFCAGGDISTFQYTQQPISANISELATTLHVAVSGLMRMAKPLIIVVNGIAAGAGMSLALIGDVVIADEAAQFTPAYTAIGLSPDAGLTWHLSKLVGLRKAQQIIMLNQTLTASEAQKIGLITEAVATEQLLQRQTQMIDQLSRSATPALACIKQLLLASHQNSLESHLQLEARTIAELSLGDTAQEGMAAFLQKRPAQFN